MIKSCIICDACGKELPIKLVKINGETHKMVKTAKTKEWDTTLIFPHLCEKCAFELDISFLKFKLELLGDRV